MAAGQLFLQRLVQHFRVRPTVQYPGVPSMLKALPLAFDFRSLSVFYASWRIFMNNLDDSEVIGHCQLSAERQKTSATSPM